MATTSIWAVKGQLGKLVVYVENPDKTSYLICYEKQGMTTEQGQELADVIDYATMSLKTELQVEHSEPVQRFVTGINCRAETARSEMMAVKTHFGKADGIVAFHGYQSFASGEVTPEAAHEIGIKLVRRLWGDRYQVLVATHLDKAHHLHNHFVLNNVSFVDGKKYYRSKKDYLNMQRESDALCAEYGLSVIRRPQGGMAKHYGEWKAEQDGRLTWRGLVKADIDAAIRQAATERQFWDNLKKLGYEVKVGKDISVRPPGKERFVRLRRNFGDDYTIEAIRSRILAQAKPERRIGASEPSVAKMRLKGSIHRAKRMTGLRALYFYYLYRIGALPRRKPKPQKVYFLLREDIRKMQDVSQQARLLAKHGIDTEVQLVEHKRQVNEQITALSVRRKQLRNQMRGTSNEEKAAAIKGEISALSGKISELRKDVGLCEDIQARSDEMREKLHRARESEKSTERGHDIHEPLGRRR